MAVHTRRGRDTEFLTEEVNLVSPLPQPCRRLIKNPFRAAPKLKTLVRQGDFHAAVPRQRRLAGLDRIRILIGMLMNRGEAANELV